MEMQKDKIYFDVAFMNGDEPDHLTFEVDLKDTGTVNMENLHDTVHKLLQDAVLKVFAHIDKVKVS